MKKVLIIDNCMQCYYLRKVCEEDYYVCEKLDEVVDPYEEIPSTCPLDNEISNKGE